MTYTGKYSTLGRHGGRPLTGDSVSHLEETLQVMYSPAEFAQDNREVTSGGQGE